MKRKDWRENKPRPEPKPIEKKKAKKKSSKVGTRNRNQRADLRQAINDWRSVISVEN